MKKKLSLVALVLLALVLAACCATPASRATRTPRASRTPGTIPSPGRRQPQVPAGGFAFGVEYMLPGGLAAAYAPLGARWVRSSTGKEFSWGTIEPQAPLAEGEHRYQWAATDRLVAEWQRAGFGIQAYTNANNPWASATRLHHVPQPEFMDDYEEFVFNLVERYDGDGDRDMPGLRAPILHYTVVEEWTGYFEGTVDDYLRILTAAHRAIKRANPQARVGLVDLFLIDVFDGNPSPQEIERRAAQDHFLRHPMSEVRELLRHPELFDLVEIHSLGDYLELYPTAEWLRAEMRRNGYEKPIWIGDALPVSSLLMARGARGLLPGARDEDFYTVAPLRPQDALRTLGWLEATTNARAEGHEAALRWWRAVQAREAVKKVVVALDAGYAGMNLAWLVDGPLPPRVTGSWGYQGLVDAEFNFATQTWKVTGLRPVFQAYRLAIAKLDGCSAVERLSLGPGIYAYRFLVRGQPLYVLWREPGRLHFPDEPEPAPVPVRVALASPRALVTHAISEMGRTEPRTETVTAESGQITLALGGDPVFVEAGP